MNKPRRVEIIQKKSVFKKFIFKIEEAQFRYEKFDGDMSETLTRLSLERGDSVAALIHNRTEDTLLLAEQFRYPTYGKGQGWLLEVVAGMVDGDEAPSDAMRREITEEIGYAVQVLHKINTFYLSPGGSSERIHLFYASVSRDDRVAKGGGVKYEGEDIRTVMLKTDEALKKMRADELPDAKTLIALQWFELNRDNLPD
jgi:nudix-type nucleoside diphosphatase (YffH/AdpP family)